MDKIKVVKSQLRLQQWAERISECQASSMTVSAWCDVRMTSTLKHITTGSVRAQNIQPLRAQLNQPICFQRALTTGSKSAKARDLLGLKNVLLQCCNMNRVDEANLVFIGNKEYNKVIAVVSC